MRTEQTAKPYINSNIYYLSVIMLVLFCAVFSTIKRVSTQIEQAQKDLEKHSTGDVILFGNRSVQVIVATNKNTTTITLPMPEGYKFKYSIFNFKHNGHEYVASIADSDKNENINFIHSPDCVICKTTSIEPEIKNEH